MIIVVTFALFRLITIKENKSIYSINDSSFICTVADISTSFDVVLDCKETITTKIEGEINIGDVLYIKGKLKEFKSNTNFNLFNYKEYQNNKNIFYTLETYEYKIIGKSNDFLLNIKSNINKKIINLKSYKYLKAFILGNKSEIDNDIITSLKNIGIIHLFSVSGMHINFLINFIEKHFKNNKRRDFFIIIFLYLYYLLINSVSLFRSFIFFLIKKINNDLRIDINTFPLIIISISIMIIIKPYIIFDIGFYYSIILSSGIMLFNKKLSFIKNKYLKKITLSIFIFILSLPLNIYTNYEINILSIIYNLLFIPLVSVIIFPSCLLTLLIPQLDNLLIIILDMFEILVNIFKDFKIIFIFIKPSMLIVILYYLIIILIFLNNKFIYIFITILLIHYNYNYLFKSSYVIFLDVGQGDSILYHYNDKNILIDTGGNNYSNISNNITVPLLKSYGIRKINFIIITHGDYDHMGEAINLVNNFKVEKIIFNCGPYNDLEQELIKVLDKKKIKYYSCIKELNIDKNKLYFLQTKEYDNENDNSNVIYTELNGYKFMFMGDASSTTEKEIMNKYNLHDIDVLKVGHHGSKTSSSKEFVDEIKPKYSIISVGKNNRYGHPNKEVLDNLEKSKIYRTDIDGSIMFKIKNNKLKVETCSP